MVPRLVTSPWRRARNLRRVGQSSSRRRAGAESRLGGVEEGAELDEVDAVLAVVVVVVAGGPADAAVGSGGLADGAAGGGIAGVAGEGLADEAFEAAFG